uniref:Small nuclear ribonucleoprotein D3 polypeptide n=1 Tax=Oncorhynchus mykiss TaxID=8022 RepID=A0A8C7U7Y6_ONCMY
MRDFDFGKPASVFLTQHGKSEPGGTIKSIVVRLPLVICMANITVTHRDGRVAQLEQVYIRDSKIRFLILPDMLKNAPMLNSMKNKNQGAGAGRGKAAVLKAQGGILDHSSFQTV